MKSRRFPIAFLLLLFLFISSSAAIAQSADQTADILARINRERVSRGKMPYALSPSLSAAAQAHANDMSRSGKLSHTGSDGSTVFVRVARAGYGAYSWGPRVGENWAWYRDTASAMQKWMASAPHRANILHDVYREIGIGVAKGPVGGFIYVTDFGAQPNVLPTFINESSPATSSPNVTLSLNDEDVYDASPANISRVKQIQVSNQADFAGADWQPFAPKIAWTLAPGNGTKTVYVKYRDARGRTVTANDAIILSSGPAVNPPPPATATQTRRLSPTPTRTRTLVPSPTKTRTASMTRTSTLTRTSTVTRTPRPSLTPTDMPIAAARFGPVANGQSQPGGATPILNLPKPTDSASLEPTESSLPPTIIPSETPIPTGTAQPPPLENALVQDLDASITPVQIAFIATESPKTTDTTSRPDLGAVASFVSGSGAGSPADNPLEPFSYGILVVGLAMSVLAFGKYFTRHLK